MNYIEQINLLHRIRRKDSLPATAVALHILLLDACNRDNWDNPVRLVNKNLQSELGVHYNTFVAARERLKQSGLISYESKMRYSYSTYTLHTTTECMAIRAKLSDELYEHMKTSQAEVLNVNAAKQESKIGVSKRNKSAAVTDGMADTVTDDVADTVTDTVTDTVADGAVYIRGIIKQNNKQNQTKNILAVDEPPPLFSENEIALNTQQPNNTSAGGGAPGKQQTATHQRCMQIYFNWFKQQFGVLPKIDGQQGKALNDLISYFAAQLPKQTTNGLAPTPHQVSNSVCQSLELVLNSWHQLDAFHQKQTKLSQLAGNIQNIIVQLKKPANATQQKQHASEQTPLWRR